MSFVSSDDDEKHLTTGYSSLSKTSSQNEKTEYNDESSDIDEKYGTNHCTSEGNDKVNNIEFSPSEVTEPRGHLSSRQKKPTAEKKGSTKLQRKTNNFLDEVVSIERSGVLSTISSQSRTNHTSNTSKIHSQRIPRILANHQRVPGGAAAKLIGRKHDDDYQFVNDGDEALEVVAPLDELIKSRDMARAEFSVGSTENKRYHAPVRGRNDNDTPLPNDGSLPRILDRDEVFHKNATAAIVSILTPSNKSTNAPEVIDILTSRSSDIHLSPSNSNAKAHPKTCFSSPFSRPVMNTGVAAVKSVAGSDVNSAVEDAIQTMTSTGKNPLVQHLLTQKTERHLAAIGRRMKDPTKNLTQLMEAIASPPNGLFDRHYMVRRKNACGALKVMTSKAAHRVNICWTVGVLPALASVLEDSGPDTLEEKFPNVSIRREFFEARKRALSALIYLALPQNNKLPIFHCPRLVASLVRVIEQDEGEARRSSCMILAHLSKSKENRLIMAQVPGLLDAITTVIEPKDNYFEEDMSSRSEGSENSEIDVFDRRSDEEVEMSLSGRSPEQTMSEDRSMSDDAVLELSTRYDEDPDSFIHGARQSVFALLSHLVKEKDNAYILARHAYLVCTLVAITKLQESSSQDFGLKFLANLSRHRANSKILVFKMKDVVPAIVFATNSKYDASRKYACYALQNFSQDKPCRQQLASIEGLLPAVCCCIRNATDPEERLGALHTLKNLSDEPANLIPMTNTPECFATLIQVAHASDENITEMMQYVGCDALATLSHWFRSIATSGHRIGMVDKSSLDRVAAKDELFVPSQCVLTWEPWQ